MQLSTTDEIRSIGLDAFVARYAMIVRRHREFPNLVFLKYNQIESPLNEPAVQECRGLILDEADDWRVVSFPFKKFFNHGEPNAGTIDWQVARVYEKLDGSLCTLYWYAGAWRVATNGLPDAGGPVGARGGTFGELFWDVWRKSGYRLPERDTGSCYMFELLTPWNRVIVPQKSSRLVLLGARDLSTGKEQRPEPIAQAHGWDCIQSLAMDSINACVAAAESLDPMSQEGYVVCDGEFRRVKIKSPRYVALAYLKETVSTRRLLEIIRTGESEEFLTYFPEWRPAYDHVRLAYDELCASIEAAWNCLKGIPDRKSFAAQAMKTRCPGALFAMLDGQCDSARPYLAAATIQAVERVVKIDATEIERLLAQTESSE